MNKKPLNKKSIINIFKRQNRIKLDTEWLKLEHCKERILADTKLRFETIKTKHQNKYKRIVLIKSVTIN